MTKSALARFARVLVIAIFKKKSVTDIFLECFGEATVQISAQSQ
jgi:hypothetical protein